MAIFDIKWSVPFDFWPKRATKKALFLYSLLLNLLLAFTVLACYRILKDINLLIKINEFIQFFLISAVIVLLFNLVLFFCWLYWRSSPRISNNEIGILFAPQSDEEASDLIYALYRQVLIELKNSSVDKIRCRLLPSNIIVTNPGIANEQLVKSGARLIIYGHFSRGNIENEKFEGFRNITFFVRHRNLHEIEKQPVLRDLASALAFRKFTLSEKNSFLDKTIVAENISNVALFFISVGLTLDGRIEEAICILDGLLQNFEPLRGNQPHLRYFENSIKSCLTVAVNSQCMYLYETHLMDNITNKEFDQVAEELEILNNRLIKINRQTSDYYLQKGIIEFHFGRLKYSWEAIKHAKDLSPKTSPLLIFV